MGMYVMGFFFCLTLTLAAFALVIENRATVPILVGLAIAQAFVQLHYFLHFGEVRLQKNLFYFMILVLLIIFLGTLWIMFDLDRRLMMHHD